jgi:Family of unknown function (DUF6498)
MTASTLGRAFDMYRRTASSRSAIALVIANAIPLIGVVFFGWSLLTILVLFWIENGIVGFWNVPKILLARGSALQALADMSEEAAFNATGNAQVAAELRTRWQQARARVATEGSGGPLPLNPMAGALLDAGGIGRAVMAFWFVIHYGIFWTVHGIFVFALPHFVGATGPACFEPLQGNPLLDDGFAPGLCESPFGEVVWSNVALAALALFLSHGASFFLNYVGKKEYLTTSAMRQMFAPYSRVVMLHLTIIFGAFVIAILGAPIGALLVLVVIKTLFDLNLHLRERQGAPMRTGVASAPGR